MCRDCENKQRASKRTNSRGSPEFIDEPTYPDYANPEARLDKPLKLYAIISDIHVPYQCTRANGAFCNLLADIKPDGLIINGDFLDLLEVSSYASGSVANLETKRIKDTFDEANVQLDLYLQAAGKQCRDLRLIEGNHENRIDRWMRTGDNAIWLGDEATDLARRLRLIERNIVYHRGWPEAYCKLGHLLVTHGRLCGKYGAVRHLDLYNHSVITGHGHTPQAFYSAGIDGRQRAGFMTGHMADDRSAALKYAPKPNSWRQGFAIVAVEQDESFHVELVNLVNKKFVYGGKLYA